jgi:hypothetical protein
MEYPLIPSETHRKEVCLIGFMHETCRYVGLGSEGWICIKNAKIAEQLRVASMVARGDNCSGPPDFSAN